MMRSGVLVFMRLILRHSIVADPGGVFNEEMALAEKGDDRQLDGFRLADHDGLDVLDDTFGHLLGRNLSLFHGSPV